MLLELAAANAAYKTISTFISNGKELGDCIGSISKLVSAEEDMRARGNRKKSSPWAKIMGKGSDDMEEFLALRQCAENRKNLESLMRLFSAPGTWQAFVEFEGEMRMKRKREAEEREREIAKMVRRVTWVLALTLSAIGVYSLWKFTEILQDL